MKKEYAIPLATLFTAMLFLGCIGPLEGMTGGGNETENLTGEGYTLKTTPENKEIMEGGTLTLELTLENPWEDGSEMKNIKSTPENYPKSQYTGGDEKNIGSIMSGQDRPVTWVINAPDKISGKETIEPEIETCFDYTTEFHFDTLLIPAQKAGGEKDLSSGHTSGPISVSQGGLKRQYTKEGGRDTSGTLNIENAWQGRIDSIKNLSLTVPKTDANVISAVTLEYTDCKKTGDPDEYTSIGSELNQEGCDNLAKNLIEDGLSTTTTIKTDGSVSEEEQTRARGKVEFRYCYTIPVGTVTAKVPGS